MQQVPKPLVSSIQISLFGFVWDFGFRALQFYPLAVSSSASTRALIRAESAGE